MLSLPSFVLQEPKVVHSTKEFKLGFKSVSIVL